MAQLEAVILLVTSAFLPVWLARGVLDIILAGLTSPRRTARRT